ncbi:MAG: dual specificity protein phosphatase family protein [Nitrososphaerales archaeon]
METAANFIDKNLKKNISVIVHCAAGKGRTGTILAAYMIKFKGVDAKNAVEKIRSKRSGSIEKVLKR